MSVAIVADTNSAIILLVLVTPSRRIVQHLPENMTEWVKERPKTPLFVGISPHKSFPPSLKFLAAHAPKVKKYNVQYGAKFSYTCWCKFSSTSHRKYRLVQNFRTPGKLRSEGRPCIPLCGMEPWAIQRRINVGPARAIVAVSARDGKSLREARICDGEGGEGARRFWFPLISGLHSRTSAR